MASKKKSKGKTIALTDFLASEPKLVTVRATNWSEIVDNEEAESKPIVVDIGVLPTAPRAAHDVDYSTVPNNPPFVAYVSNLSFEADDNALRNIFASTNPKSARILRDGIRSRGIGLVEFETHDNLIEALKKNETEVYGRKIRVAVSDRTDLHSTDSGRGTFDNHRSHRGPGEERSNLSGRWIRNEQRSDNTNEDRSSGGFNRDRPHRSDHGRSNMNSGPRDNQTNNDFGFGYPRSKDERTGGGRDYNRQGNRQRFHDGENRANSGAGDRPPYAGRYSDTRDTRDRNRTSDNTTSEDHQDAPRERQKLQLQPRTKPLEEQLLSGPVSSANNVAAQLSVQSPDDSSPLQAQNIDEETDGSPENENQDGSQHELQDSVENNSGTSTKNEQSTAKPSRGAGASIFGGAKPVDTSARELEIEKKLQELQMANTETSGDNEEKASGNPPRPSYNRGGDRDHYRPKRPSNNEDRPNRERRDEGRYSQGADHHKRDNDDSRKPHDDEFYRRGGQDRDRHGGISRRDNDSNRTGKYNHPERDDRGNFRHRDRNSNEFSTQGRPSNTNSNPETQARNQQRGMNRLTVQKDDDSNRLQLSNKFCMLDNDDVNDNDENDDAQSPSIDE